MPESHLWLINHLGTVFTLGTSHRKFRQLENTFHDSVNVKRLSASHWCAWAVGHDHRVYIYVRSSDVPIRVPETMYENQRWSPFHGFSKRSRLKTDRPAWSNEAGTVYRPKESVRLPSSYWEWEGDWMIDDNLHGDVVGIEGWQYAFDFPAVYTPDKHVNSFVRRRKWIRFRRFSSTEMWARISDMEVVEKTECFIDVSVGGFLIPSQPAGFLSVWAVTNNGHVYVRTDVSHDNPEGCAWQEIEISEHPALINISVGASNLVWAVTWDGNTLVRTEVTRNNVYGSGWAVVEHPDNSTRFMQVSVGRNAVWAVSRDFRVWFRKGTSGDNMFWNYDCAVGTSWVEMVGEMSQVAVSSNDQVFAVDLTGKNIYFRTGVTAVDLTGRTWQQINLQEDLSVLEKEGLLSEGDVCSCGDQSVPCALHSERRPRLSSISSSSISTVTNIEESSDEFLSPLQPYEAFPVHFTEPFSDLDSPLDVRSEFVSSDSDAPVFECCEQAKETLEGLTDVSSCLCLHQSPAVESIAPAVNFREQSLVMNDDLQKSFTPNAITSSVSQTLSQDSSFEEITSTSQQFVVVTMTPAAAATVATSQQPVVVSTTPDAAVTMTTAAGMSSGCRARETICEKDVQRENEKFAEVTNKPLDPDVEGPNDKRAKTDEPEDKNNSVNITAAVLKTASQVKYCESSQEVDSEMYAKVHYNSEVSLEDRIIKEFSVTPSTEVTKDGIKENVGDRTLTELSHCPPEASGLPENFLKPNQELVSHEDQIIAVRKDFTDRESSFTQSGNILHISLAEADESHVSGNSSLNKSVRTLVLVETEMGTEHSTAAKRLSEEDTSSSVHDLNVCVVNTQPGVEHASWQEENKKQVVRKKKGKEKRPEMSHGNDDDDDSIVYKSSRPRKKRREKLASVKSNGLDETDAVGVNVNMGHGLVDAIEMQSLQSQGVETSEMSRAEVPSGNSSETDMDFVDKSKSALCPRDQHKSSNQKHYVDICDLEPAFPSLSNISGDYFTAIGFRSDPVFSVLADSETTQMQLSYIRTLETDTNKTTVTGYDADSNHFNAVYEKDYPKPYSECDSPKPNLIVLEQEGTPTSRNLIMNDQDCKPDVGNSLTQGMILRDPQAAHSCDNSEHIILTSHNIDGDIIPDENSHMEVFHINSVGEDIPVKESEHSLKPVNSVSEIETEIMKSHSSNNDPSGNSVPNFVIKASNGMTSNKDSETGSLQLLKCEQFSDNNFTSLDSASTLDETINFVTDLLPSDDEVLDKKGQTKSDKAQVDPECSFGDVESEAVSRTEPGSMGYSESRFGSQVSVNSFKSAYGSLSNKDRDFSEDDQNEGEKSAAQSAPHVDHHSVLPLIAATPPKTLPFDTSKSTLKDYRHRKISSPNIVPTDAVIPMTTLTVAQPRLCWRWLDATSCVIDDAGAVEWLLNSSKESDTRRKRAIKIARHLREDIMKKLQDRNKREVHRFKDIEQAVKRTTWVKKAAMQMYQYGRKSRWIACNVELEQGISNLSDGCLTIHYQHKGKQKNTQIPLSEMTCVKTCSDPNAISVFVVYTAVTNIIHQPLMLKTGSENETSEWVACLCAANASAWNLNCPVAPGAIWSCTFTGDIFVSQASSATQNPSELCWGQHGGHMRLIETGPSGVTWALGFDKMPYVYNNGYGGAINFGTGEMSDNVQQVVDHHRVYVYENQKWFPFVGWCSKGIFQNDFHWLTESGHSLATKEEVKLPSSKCQWISEWTIDFSTTGGVDTHGWQYSSSLYGPFYPRQHLRSSYRRRRWVRRYKITLFGPWQTAGSLGLVDLSIQVDPVSSTSDPVVMWAVGANGDVLIRNGVMAVNPKGQSWTHIATYLDKPFKSVSVGGGYRVWGIAGDGSAWFRPEVNSHNPAGTCWLQVVPPPPGNFLLHQVSAGATSVWAVDTGDNLWRRENITPTFPEGTGWEMVASRVKRVSVGPRDQVWIIADASFCKTKHGAGVIYRRVGITSTKPSGTTWEMVFGNGWAHVSVRGVSEVKLEDSSSLHEEGS